MNDWYSSWYRCNIGIFIAVQVLQEEMKQAITLNVSLKVKICHGMN